MPMPNPTANGIPQHAKTSLKQLREDHERARLNLERLQYEQAARLHEWGSYPQSYTGNNYGDLVDPSDAYRDGENLFQPIGTLTHLQRGGFRFESENDQLRTFARLLALTNPFARGILCNLRNFIIGTGFTYRATSAEAEPQLVAQVQAVLDEFADVNLWSEKEQEILLRTVRDGEVFVRLFDNDGLAEVRFIDPTQVREPPGHVQGDGWDYGIFVDPRDAAGPFERYHVQYDESGADTQEVDAGDVVPFQVNKDSGEKRGLSEFYCNQEVLEGTRKLLRNMREGAALQAAIAGITQHNATGSTVRGLLDSNENFSRAQLAPGNKTISYKKYEPGSWVHIGASSQYIDPPFWGKDTASRVDIVQACLRAAGAAYCMPEYMVSGDSSNSAYASTLVAGSPFVREAKARQAWLKYRFLIVLWKAVEIACNAGRIDAPFREVERLIDIQCEAPLVEIENRLEEAQVNQLMLQAGVKSKQTWRGEAGLDSDQERQNLADEPIQQTVDTGFGGLGDLLATPTDPSEPAPDSLADKATDAAQTSDNADATGALRATVGGSQAIAQLQRAYYAGELPREACIANATVVFGFSPEEAEQLFPPKPPNPPGGPALPVASPAEGGAGPENPFLRMLSTPRSPSPPSPPSSDNPPALAT